MRLERPLEVREVAALAGWPPWKMRRELLRIDGEQNGRLLLVRGSGKGTRYRVTLAALRRAAPYLFDEWTDLRDDVDGLGEVARDHGGKILMLAREVGGLKRRMTALEVDKS